MMLRPIEIVGGGLAGLSLGIALRRAGVPVAVWEAGSYPRHRVCGEFIAGLSASTLAVLGVEKLLADAKPHRSVTWHRRGERVKTQQLGQPALALSRYTLDARLAEEFCRLGGDLSTGQRSPTDAAPDGRVFAFGRRRSASSWLGLKLHVRKLPLASDLEFHLGSRGYVGLCPVDRNAVNVCGLFRLRPELSTTRESALLAYLKSCDMHALAERIEGAEVDAASFSAVAGMAFSRICADRDRLCVGDAYAMIPPFTGNGMASAFQSAALAVAPLLAWARKEVSWPDTLRSVRRALFRRLSFRLRLAVSLHPFLLSPAPQQIFTLASRAGFLPLRALATAFHA